MKITFALLAHGEPDLTARLIRLLISEGHTVVVHYDAKSTPADFECLAQTFGDANAVRFTQRVSVGWGQWGVVQATLNCLREIEAAKWDPNYVYLISGTDYPIRSSAELVSFLQRNNGDEFIESVPADETRWVKTGPQCERYQYRWWFNWRSQQTLTDLLFACQKALKLQRPFVRGITPHIGSQWWTLTWSTLKKILKLAEEPDIAAFFKSTLVPDELFFQTMVRVVAKNSRVVNTSLTLFTFSDYGVPVVYCIDHTDYLVRQPFFMARKFSSHDLTCRDRLEEYWRGRAHGQSFGDLDVGIAGRDYEQRRLTYRHGPPGLPVPGMVRPAGTCALGQVGKPFFAVVGGSVVELGRFKCLASMQPEVLMHGELFHPERLEFESNRDNHAGYGELDTAIRDMDPENFLADILRAERVRTTGFSLRLGATEQAPDSLFDSAHLHLIVLQADPALSFLESLIDERLWADVGACASVLAAMPERLAADRFRQFAHRLQANLKWLSERIARVSARASSEVAIVEAMTWPSQWSQSCHAALGVRPTAGNAHLHPAMAETGLESEEVRAMLRAALVKGGIAEDALYGMDWRHAGSDERLSAAS